MMLVLICVIIDFSVCNAVPLCNEKDEIHGLFPPLALFKLVTCNYAEFSN